MYVRGLTSKKEHTDNAVSSENDESAKLPHVKNCDQQGEGDTYAMAVTASVRISQRPGCEATKGTY